MRSDSLEPARDYLPRIRFAPVDANVLLNNILRDVRDWPRPTQMRLLAAGGMYRLFAPDHISGEVEGHLDRVAMERGQDAALAGRVWAREYLPLIRFVSVDVSQLSMFDPRIAAVMERDADDAPTAALAILLGVKVLSEDTDLLDPGLASGRSWLEVVFASNDVTVGETANLGLALTTSLTIDSVGALARRVASIGATGPGRLSLVLCIAFICVVLAGLAHSERARGRTKAALQSIWQRSAPMLAWALREYAQAAQNRSTGLARLAKSDLSAPEGLQELAAATRLLAAASTPISSMELARQMWAYERVPQGAAGHVEVLLRSLPMFIETPGVGWQLGRVVG
jgi:predicted nucleic acid-binding protein